MKLTFLIFFIMTITACQQSEENTTFQVNLPSFKAKDILTGQEYSKTSFTKPTTKAIYLHFWATWCGPCEVEFPDFIRYAKKMEKDNVFFIAVAINDKPHLIKKFLKRFGELPKNMTVIMETEKMSQRYGTTKLPETFLLNNKGEFMSKYIGPQNWGSSFYFDQVQKL